MLTPSPFPPRFRRHFGLIHLGFRFVVRLLAPRFRVSGRKNLPYRGGVILAPSHRSDFDPPVLGAASLRRVAWLAKRELWQYGWLARVLDFVGSFPVDPASPDRAALKRAREVLDQGEALVVFPEGKISPSGELLPLLPGVILMAMQARVPVVPVGLIGSNGIIPYGSTIPRPTLKRVRVHFGPPISFEDLREMPSRQARVLAMQRLEEGIRAALEIAEKS